MITLLYDRRSPRLGGQQGFMARPVTQGVTSRINPKTKKGKTMDHIDEIALEDIGMNTAALSAMLHDTPETYEQIHRQLPNDFGGFIGIWELCARAGYIFFLESTPYRSEDYYWTEALESYAYRIIDHLICGIIPNKTDLHRLAAGSIEQNKQP